MALNFFLEKWFCLRITQKKQGGLVSKLHGFEFVNFALVTKRCIECVFFYENLRLHPIAMFTYMNFLQCHFFSTQEH